jgi:acyl-CoA synthetase (NDP forming)
MACDDAPYRALFAASGVATVNTLEGLMTAAALLARPVPSPSMRW